MKNTNFTSKQTSITEGKIWKALLIFFFPILIGTLFQQLYNTIDAIIVGKFLDKESLAAVGGGTAVYLTLIIGFFVGISSGAGVVIAQLYGANRKTEASRAVHTSLSLSLIGGAIMTIGGVLASRWVMDITKTPDDIKELSIQYLNIFFVSMIPMFVYNMASGILRAAGDSKTPLYILIAAVFTNIILDSLFVLVFDWKVAGVAWATVLSQIESMIVSLVILYKKNSCVQFRFRKIELNIPILLKMLKIGFPAGIQSTFYGLSNIIIQSAINSFGTTTIAAWAAYSKIDAVFWTIVNAMGVAVTTFAGQNYGAGKIRRVTRSMWESFFITLIFTIFSTVFFWLTGRLWFNLFAKDADVILSGMEMMHFLVPVWVTYISIEILSGVIRGTGDSFIPMIISLFGICALRIFWLFTAVPHFNTVKSVIASYPITWVVTSIAFWIYWFTGKWLKHHR